MSIITVYSGGQSEEQVMADPSCAVCGARGDALKKCGRCQLVFYCSRQHQKTDFALHQASCRAPMVEDPTAVDPMSVLSHHEVVKVCSYLRSADLLALRQVSRAWRRQVGERDVWRRVSLRLANNRRCLEALRFAPYLRCLTLPRDLPPGLRAAIMESATQVEGLRWEHRGDPQEVEDVVSKFAAHLRRLHLGPVDCHAVHLLAGVPVRSLRSLSVHTVTRGDHGSFMETADGGNTVRTHFGWLANDPEDCDRTCWRPMPLMFLLEENRSSLEDVEIEALGAWALQADEVTWAVARCGSLRRAVLPCSAELPLLAGLPALRSLTVLMRSHIGSKHDRCLSALPASLEHLTVVSHYGTLRPELEQLVRQAPRLAALRSLTLRWRHYVGGRRQLTDLEKDPRPTLALAFPGVALVWDMRVVSNYAEMVADMQGFDR